MFKMLKCTCEAQLASHSCFTKKLIYHPKKKDKQTKKGKILNLVDLIRRCMVLLVFVIIIGN
jgi:hypothetical protein